MAGWKGFIMYRLALIVLLSPFILLLIFSLGLFVHTLWGIHPVLGAVAAIAIYGAWTGKYRS